MTVEADGGWFAREAVTPEATHKAREVFAQTGLQSGRDPLDVAVEASVLMSCQMSSMTQLAMLVCLQCPDDHWGGQQLERIVKHLKLIGLGREEVQGLLQAAIDDFLLSCDETPPVDAPPAQPDGGA